MSDPIITHNFIERLANGYRSEIEQLEQEQKRVTDPVRLHDIALTLNAKRWQLQRHLADLERLPA